MKNAGQSRPHLNVYVGIGRMAEPLLPAAVLAFVIPAGRWLKTQQRLGCERATVAATNGHCMFIGRNGEQMWVNRGSYSALEPPRR